MPALCSVVIPVYNRWKELLRALRSVHEQTYRHVEIIVVDDGSTVPHAGPVVNATDFVRKCHPVKWITLSANRGPSNARNKGLEAARGEFVTFLDSDDAMLPEKLEQQITVLQRNDKSAAVMCGYMESHGSSNTVIRLPQGDVTLERLLSFDRSLAVTGPSVLYRTSVVREVGGFDPFLHAVEEYDLLVRIVANGGAIRPLRAPLLHVDVSDETTHLSQDFNKQAIGRLRFLEKHDVLLKQFSKARAENYLCLGIVRFRAGKMRHAIPAFLRVLRINPLILKAWVYLLCCATPWLYPFLLRTAKITRRPHMGQGVRPA